MITFETDFNNDLVIGDDGNLSLITAIKAVSQTAEHYAYTLRGEMLFAADLGVPFFDVAFGATPNIAQFESFMRSRIMEVDEVVRINSLTATQVDDSLMYNAEIVTIYGVGNISNGL